MKQRELLLAANGAERLLLIQAAIFKALDEINLQRPANNRLEKSPNTVLIGPQGGLDSLELLTLFVTIEQELSDNFKVSVSLAEEDLFSLSPNPFERVEALALALQRIVAGKSGSVA